MQVEKDETQRLRFKVHLPALFREIASHTKVRGSPGAIMGLEIIQKSLYNIAQRALEIDDAIIIKELEVMAVLRPAEGDANEQTNNAS